VRAADIPEYVQDGVVDCGITGADLVAERGARVRELLRLGFGGCTLEAAVPQESPVAELAQLGGLRVATVYRNLTSRLLAERERSDAEALKALGWQVAQDLAALPARATIVYPSHYRRAILS